MIRKKLNVDALKTSTFIPTQTGAGCCDEDLVACKTTIVYNIVGADKMVSLSMVDGHGVTQVLDLSTTAEVKNTILQKLIDFIEDNGYIVEGPESITVDIVADTTITFTFIGEAEFPTAAETDGAIVPTKICNHESQCEYSFETDGNEAAAVSVGYDGDTDTVAAFDFTDTAAAVKILLDGYFTSVISLTVVKNTVTEKFEVTIVDGPAHTIFIDGAQGVKSNCQSVWVA